MTILAIFLPLYFPTGRLLPTLATGGLVIVDRLLVFAVAGNALMPGPNRRCWALLRCPTRWCSCPRPRRCSSCLALAWLCSLAGFAGAIAALVVRFRRSRGIERQQLKWFTYAAALTPLPFLAHDSPRHLRAAAHADPPPGADQCVGTAILRHRLYEIDQILNRTPVYGLLTVILGLRYAAGR